MKLKATTELFGFGTSEGAVRGWDTRGRGRHVPAQVYHGTTMKRVENILRKGLLPSSATGNTKFHFSSDNVYATSSKAEAMRYAMHAYEPGEKIALVAIRNPRAAGLRPGSARTHFAGLHVDPKFIDHVEVYDPANTKIDLPKPKKKFTYEADRVDYHNRQYAQALLSHPVQTIQAQDDEGDDVFYVAIPFRMEDEP